MRVRERETYLRVQAFEMGKMTSIDELINGGLSFVNTVHRKLPHSPEGISAAIWRALMIGLVVPCSYCKNAGEGRGGRRGGGGVCTTKTTTTTKKARCNGHTLTSSKNHLYLRLHKLQRSLWGFVFSE